MFEQGAQTTNFVNEIQMNVVQELLTVKPWIANLEFILIYLDFYSLHD